MKKKFSPALSLEQLESRFCPSAVCEANSTYQGECAYLDNLLPQNQATITAVESGNWSNAATWGGRTPTTGDNVYIPQGFTVTVDKQESGALRSILNNGILTFAPGANTSLLVNTLVSGTDTNSPGNPQGELDIGTASNPIQAGFTAQLIFADSQSVVSGETQAQLFPQDTEALSGGLLSMGTLNMYGSQVTPYVNLLGSAGAGSSTLSLVSAPQGWKAGDTLLIPGTDPGQTHDEQIQIASIQGATVTLASPLQYTHSAPSGQSIQVADEARNVVIEDQGTSTQYQDGADGHVMQMHNDAVSIQYVAFLDPGRTDKSIPEGSILPNGLVNIASRYALHFHECYWPGYTDNDPAIQVVGCYQAGGVGWGYVNHRSNVDFTNDVAFNDYSGAFVDQAGDELGAFQGCLSVDTMGPGVDTNVEGRSGVHDWGWNGQGFWLVSPQTSVLNCTAYEAMIGFDVYTVALSGQGFPQALNLFNGQSESAYPLAPYQGDTAANCAVGIYTYWRTGPQTAQDTYSHFTAWGVSEIGVKMAGYVQGMIMPYVTLLAAPGSNAPDGYLDVSITPSQDGVSLTNADVEGFQVGAVLPSAGLNAASGYWNNKTDFQIHSAKAPRQIAFSSLTFGPNSNKDYDLIAQDLQQTFQRPGGGCGPVPANEFFSNDQILLPDGNELWFPQQLPTFIPVASGSGLPLAGLTVDQILSQYGSAVGGAEAPSSAVPLAGSNGYEGTAWQEGPGPILRSSPYTASGAYTLKYQLGTFPDDPTYPIVSIPVTLQPGWNLLTENVNGQAHTFFIYGT